MSRPARIRPGGWVNERWRHRAAQVTRAEDLTAAVEREAIAETGEAEVRVTVDDREARRKIAILDATLDAPVTP